MVGTEKLAMLILGLLLLLVSAAVGSSIWGFTYWTERIAHFQIQYWVLAILLIGLLALSRRKQLFWAGLVGLALLSVNLLTWYMPANHQAVPFLKVFSSNNWVYNHNYPALLELVRTENPDIAMFYEVNATGQKYLDTLSDILPYSVGRGTGAQIYTKLSLAGTKQALLGNAQYPEYPGTTVIENLQYLGRTFTLVATHTASPHSREQFLIRNQQLENLAGYMASSDQALIVAGDFNVTMWSPYYRRFTYQANLISTRPGFGVIPTWTPARVRSIPALLQPWLSIPIDHIFTRSGQFELKTMSMKAGNFVGSDHLPVIAQIGVVNKS
jgi:endonuclease/exonuclease/phosphatase (EEP) superfamily protein YafD